MGDGICDLSSWMYLSALVGLCAWEDVMLWKVSEMAIITLSIDLIFSSWGSKGKHGMTYAAQSSHSCRLVRKVLRSSLFKFLYTSGGAWGL